MIRNVQLFATNLNYELRGIPEYISIFRCSGVVPVWDKQWDKHVETEKSEYSIVWPLIKAFGPAYAISALYQLGYR